MPVVKEADIGASPIPATPSSSSERGEPLVTLAWPPRVLDPYPFTARMKTKRNPQSQPGSPGGTSPGGALVSPASLSSEHVFLEPITTPEDENTIAAMDAA